MQNPFAVKATSPRLFIVLSKISKKSIKIAKISNISIIFINDENSIPAALS